MSDPRGVRSDSQLRRIVHQLTQLMAFIAVFCIVGMLLAIVADVTRRTVAGEAVPGVVELAEVAMVVIVFLGLGFAERRGTHVSMTLVVRKLRPRTAAMVNGLGLLLVVVVVGWMVWVTADRALESFAVKEFRFGLVRVPVWPARVALAVGLAVYFLELVFRLLDDIRAARGRVAPTAESDEPDSTAHVL